MLKLTQVLGDSIYIFDKTGRQIAKVKYVELKGKQIALGFDADDDITILREKVLLERNKNKISNIVKPNKPRRIIDFNGNLKTPDKTVFFMDNEEEIYDEHL